MTILTLIFLASLFYLIPTSIGRSIALLTFSRKKEEHLSSFPIYFVLGAAIIFSIAMIIQYFILSIASTASFSHLFFPTIYVIEFCSLLINVTQYRKMLKLFNRHTITIFLFSFILSAIAYSIWIWKSPYSLNWDLYEHQTLVHLITSGNFNYFTSRISDTFGFNSYPPVFHSLMAVSQFPKELQPEEILQYWNVISFLHLWIVSFISYGFSYVVTKNKNLSVLSCILGTLTFESVIAFTSFFLLPQTLAAVIFISLFSTLIWRKKHQLSVSSFEVVLSVLLLVFFHYIVGGFGMVILLATLIYFSLHYKMNELSQNIPLMEILCICIIVGAFSTQFVDLKSLNHGEAASYIFTLSDKIAFMAQSYGFLFLFGIPLGILAAFRKQQWLQKYLLFIGINFLVLLLTPIPYALKFYVLARWFVLFFVAQGMWSLIEKQSFSFFRTASFLIISLFLCGILTLNSVFWKQGLTVDQQVSHVSQDELAAAQFLRDNFKNESLLIISDPATQYILEGLSGVNSPGGSFANTGTRNSLSAALSHSSGYETAVELRQIQDSIVPPSQRTFIVFSGRLFTWQTATDIQKQSFDFNIWQSRQLKFSNLRWLDSLDAVRFAFIYQNNSLQIRELR